MPFIIKVAGPEVYGAFALLASYMSMLTGVSSLGIGTIAKRNMPAALEPSARSGLFYPQFWFQLLSAGMFASASIVIGLLLVEHHDVEWAAFSPWMMMTYLVPFVVFSQTTDFYRYTHRIGSFNLLTVIHPYLFIGLTVIGYAFGQGVTLGLLVAAHSVSSVLVGGAAFLALSREIGLKCILPDRAGARADVRVGIPLVLSFLVDFVLAGGDRYIIAAVLTVRDVGSYVPAYALGSLILVVPRVLGVVLPPLLAQHIDAGDERAARHLMTSAARFFLILAFPFAAGALVLGRDVLEIFATSEIAKDAWPVIPLVSVGATFCGMTMIRSSLLFVRLRTSTLLKANLLGACSNVVLNVILLHSFQSVVVAALATLVAYIMGYVFVSSKIGEDSADLAIEWMWVVRLASCAAGMAIAVALCRGVIPATGLGTTLLNVVVGIGVYGGLILLDRSNWRDIANLRQALTAR